MLPHNLDRLERGEVRVVSPRSPIHAPTSQPGASPAKGDTVATVTREARGRPVGYRGDASPRARRTRERRAGACFLGRAALIGSQSATAIFCALYARVRFLAAAHAADGLTKAAVNAEAVVASGAAIAAAHSAAMSMRELLRTMRVLAPNVERDDDYVIVAFHPSEQ